MSLFRIVRLIDRLTSVVLLAAMVFMFGMPSAFVAWFKVEQDRIAATLCVKKENPENGCQGNCQMSKMLNKIESNSDEERTPDPNRIETKEIQMLIEHDGADRSLNSSTTLFQMLSERLLEGVDADLFRPPMVRHAA